MSALHVPSIKNILAEHILEEANVVRLIAPGTDKHNPALLPLGHLAGLRISAICGRRWRDTKRPHRRRPDHSLRKGQENHPINRITDLLPWNLSPCSATLAA